MSCRFTFCTPIIAASVSLLTAQLALGQYTPYFVDTFDVSEDTLNISFESESRQGGDAAPILYVTNSPEPNNHYFHQLFSASSLPTQPLQLTEDGSLDPDGPPSAIKRTAMVSPDFNFNDTLPNGDIVGKRITFDLDVA